MKRIYFFFFCLVAISSNAQNNTEVELSVNQINGVIAPFSLQTKANKHYNYVSVTGSEVVFTDSLLSKSYDKSYDLYLYKNQVFLKDIADIVFEQKIAATWCRIVLKPDGRYNHYYNGKQENSTEGIIIIMDKSFSKGDGPDQLKAAFRKLFEAAGLPSPF